MSSLLFIWLLISTVLAVFNAIAIPHGIVGKTWHTVQWFVVAFLAYVLADASTVIWWRALPVLAVAHWIVFDLLLNLMRQKEWYYIGNTWIIDRYARRIFKDPRNFFVVKWALFILTALIFNPQ